MSRKGPMALQKSRVTLLSHQSNNSARDMVSRLKLSAMKTYLTRRTNMVIKRSNVVIRNVNTTGKGAITLQGSRGTVMTVSATDPIISTDHVTYGHECSTNRRQVTEIIVAASRFSFFPKKRVPTEAATVMQGARIGSANTSSKRGIESAPNSTRVKSIVLHSGASKQHFHVNSSTGADSWNHKMALHIRGDKQKQGKQEHQARNRYKGLIFVIPGGSARG